MHPNAQKLIAELGLLPHPEGGHYREVIRSSRSIEIPGQGPRSYGSKARHWNCMRAICGIMRWKSCNPRKGSMPCLPGIGKRRERKATIRWWPAW